LIVLSLVYFVTISDYIPIIRQNTPISFMLSYGFKVPFLGLDHLREEAGLRAIALANTWVPITLAGVTLILAVIVAFGVFRHPNSLYVAADGVAGTAFLFGAGVYC